MMTSQGARSVKLKGCSHSIVHPFVHRFPYPVYVPASISQVETEVHASQPKKEAEPLLMHLLHISHEVVAGHCALRLDLGRKGLYRWRLELSGFNILDDLGLLSS